MFTNGSCRFCRPEPVALGLERHRNAAHEAHDGREPDDTEGEPGTKSSTMPIRRPASDYATDFAVPVRFWNLP